MPFPSGLVRMSIRGTWMNQRVQVTQLYSIQGLAGTIIDAAELVAGYWNAIKGRWRAAQYDAANVGTTDSVFASEFGPTGEFLEYAIPVSERTGLRSTQDWNGPLPSFTAVACKQVVATRVTRPGQKRFWGLAEIDQASGVLSPETVALFDGLGAVFAQELPLWEPALLVSLVPLVGSVSPDGQTLQAHQPVTGWSVNRNVSTQNSRKPGRGI